MTRTCMECPSPIARYNKTGRCQPCSNRKRARDPEQQAKRKEALAAFFAQPENKERYRRMLASNMSANQAQFQEGQRRGSEKANAAKAWYPPEYRKLVEKLRKHGVPLAERKKIVLAKMAEAEASRLASMTMLERQLEKVRNGAKVVDKWQAPRTGYGYSLLPSSMA